MTLDDLIDDMSGRRVACAQRVPGAVPTSALHPAEAEAVARAVSKRRHEMAAGRAAARAALAQLGFEDVTVPASPFGAPVWPGGTTGSIAHSDAIAVAIAASMEDFASVGIDVEPEGGLEEALWPAITTERELGALRTLPPPVAAERARLLFCIKEAAYKCQYPLTGLLLDFGDLEIACGWEDTTKGPWPEDFLMFDAIYRRSAPPFRLGDRIPGRIGRVAGHVLALALLPAEDAPVATSSTLPTRSVH